MKTPDLQGLRASAAAWAAQARLDPAAAKRLEEIGRLAAADGLSPAPYRSRIEDALQAGQSTKRVFDPWELAAARQFVLDFALQFSAMSDLFSAAADGADGSRRQRVALDPLPPGPHQNAESVMAITEGSPAQAIFVATHIVPKLQPALAATLGAPRFAKTPRLFLVGGKEPLTSTELIGEASVLRSSGFGVLEDVKLNCSRFHLAGGVYLYMTTRQLIEEHAQSANAATPLELEFHAEHIFDTYEVTLAALMRAGPETPRAYALAARDFLKPQLPTRYSIGDPSVVVEGGQATITASFASADGRHRGEMRIVARTAADVLSAR